MKPGSHDPRDAKCELLIQVDTDPVRVLFLDFQGSNSTLYHKKNTAIELPWQVMAVKKTI